MDHFKHPRHKQVLESADREGKAFNANCGDAISIQLELADGAIKNIGYQLRACAACTAAASMLAETVIGMSTEQCQALHQQVYLALTEQGTWPKGFEALAGATESIGRHKCILLPWQALETALKV